MSVLLILWCMHVADPVASMPDVPPPESAMSQPSDVAESKAMDEAGQIEDAARLIVGDHTNQARRIGVRTLLRIGSAAALDRLTSILTQPNEGNGAAHSAIYGVIAESESPPSALLSPLIEMIGEQRGSALDGIQAALAAYPQADAQRSLCDIARDTTANLKRRAAAIEMIGRLGEDYSAAGVLAGLTSDPDAGIRGTALRAFSRMTGVEFDDGPAATNWWREHAGLGELKWLARSNQRRREELRALHAERDSLAARLVEAYRGTFLSLAEKDQGDRLVAMLKDNVADVRKLGLDLIAAMIIDQKEVSKAVREAIMPVLSDSNMNLRRQAAVIAGNLRIAGAADVMIASLESESHPRVRAALAGALGRLDDTRAIQPLIKCLASSDRELVGEATLALGSLARRGHPEGDKASLVTKSLASRFDQLAVDDDELREKFLRAMSRIGAESFRAILERESRDGRSTTIRTTAIAGLSTYDSEGTAEFLVGLLSSDAPPVRGAAIQTLGRIGRTRSHFNVLFDRSKTEQESEAVVRDKAWEAALSVFSRLSGIVRLQILTDLNSTEDLIVQRRRSILARALKSDRDATNELTAGKRLEVTLMLGDALLRAGDYSGALTEFQEVSQFRSELSKEVVLRIEADLVRSGMRAGRHEDVVKSLSGSLNATSEGERDSRRELLRQCLEQELEASVSAAASGEAIASLTMLVEQAAAALGGGEVGTAFQSRCKAAIDARRDTVIDGLLELEPNEAGIAEKLQSFDKPAVVSRIHAKLTSIKPTTTGPVFDREAALIALTRKIVPEWPGYTPGNSTDERTKALDQLIAG